MTFHDRSASGLVPRRGGTRFTADDVRGVAIHWNGPPVGAGASRGEREGVRSYLRGVQRFHMGAPPTGRGWSDAAYNLAVDNAGNVWELRGLDYRSGANGGTAPNSQYVAILAVIGERQQPTAAMREGLREAVAMVRRRYPRARQIETHNGVRPTPTECPGPDLTRAVARGDLEPGAKPTPAPTPPEDDMPLNAADKKWLTDHIGPRADVVPVGDPNGKNPNWQVNSVLAWLVKASQAQNARIKALASPRDIATAVVAALPAGVAVTSAQLEAALRSVLGSVDE